MTSTREVLMPAPDHHLSPDELARRVERFSNQIDLVLENVGPLGELPDYLVPKHADVRAALAKRYERAGWTVTSGIDEAPWMRIVDADSDSDTADTEDTPEEE